MKYYKLSLLLQQEGKWAHESQFILVRKDEIKNYYVVVKIVKNNDKLINIDLASSSSGFDENLLVIIKIDDAISARARLKS